MTRSESRLYDARTQFRKSQNALLKFDHRRRSVYMDLLTLSFRKFCLAIAVLLLLCIGIAAQQKAETRNMDLVGYNDLQARSAYQPTIHKQGDRWIAYIGHHGGSQLNPLTGKAEDNGTSIVDVTDPK